MKKKQTWEQAKSAANFRIGLFACFVGLLPTVGAALMFYAFFAAAKPENRWPDYKPKQQDEDNWSTASFEDETFGGFEESLDTDFTFDTNEIDDSFWDDEELFAGDADDAYDYSINADASFDTSFVEDDYSHDSASDSSSAFDLLETAWKSADIYDAGAQIFIMREHPVDTSSVETSVKQDIHQVELQGVVIDDVDEHTSRMVEAFTYDDAATTIEYVEIAGETHYTVTVWAYDAAEGWFYLGKPISCSSKEFSSIVGQLIDTDNVDVLLSMAPTEVDDIMSPSRLFNRFDDKVTADYVTRVTDWDNFYDKFEGWESGLDEHSIGFICYNDTETNTRMYTALAYDARGNYLGETTFATELQV